MKPSSHVKIRACRLNGVLFHGLYSKQVVFPNDALHPRNSFELELVREMAVARWCEQRIWTTAKRMITENMPQISPTSGEIIPESAAFDEDDEQTREQTQATQAFRTLAQNSPSFRLPEHARRTPRGPPGPGNSEFSISNPPDDFFMDAAK